MTDENQQLDDAMRRADDLLRDSLQHEEKRRSRRKLAIAAAALAVACVFATAVWFMPDRRSAANIEPIQQTNQPAETKNSYAAELLALTEDWRAAYSVGQRLADADPDAALKTLNENWSRIGAFEARQQILKAFVFDHPRVLDVLHLGMTDPEPQVQAWATRYLRSYAFADFAEHRAAYDDWRKQTEGKPLNVVAADNARAWVEKLKAASPQEQAEQSKYFRDARSSFNEIPAARKAAVDAGLLDLIAQWMRQQQGNEDFLGYVSELAVSLQPDQAYLRREILPLLADDQPVHIRGIAARIIGRKGNAWAVDPLVDALKKSLLAPDSKRITWPAAQSLGEIGDPRAIPHMIAVIDADNTYDTVYGVGYFGLSEMTGVHYDEKHDGAWWKAWWEREKSRFPEPARSATIPTIDKSSSAARGVANPIYAMIQTPDPPVQDLRAAGEEKMRFFLIGPVQPEAPADGYRLLLVLPGGDGSADFQPFVTNMLPNALPENYIIAQLVSPGGNPNLIWPTEKSRDPGHKDFTTEKFIDAVVEDVKKLHKIDPKHIYALGWSSGGPPAYAAAMRPTTPLAGAFVAMSVFKPAELPPAKNLAGRAFYILHSPTDFIQMRFPQAAKTMLAKAGAKTHLQTYEGGHGWHGDVFGMIRTGIDWLEAN